jgi:VanZ family protein
LEDEPAPVYWPRLTVRRWLCAFYALSWSIALIVPVPIKPRDPSWVEPLWTFSKSLHVAAYAVFAGLCAWMLLPCRYRWLLIVLLLGHAMLTEYVQYLTHDFFGRTGQWSDVGLDAIGIVLGVSVMWKWWWAAAAPTKPQPVSTSA